MSSNCIFCKIINKEIPANIIAEDETTMTLLDAFPHAKGHTLVIPKVHAETIFTTNDSHMNDVLMSVQKAMERIQSVLNPDGFNVGWNHNAVAGQAVPHWHIHIIPRWEKDGGGSFHSIIKNDGGMKPGEVFELFK